MDLVWSVSEGFLESHQENVSAAYLSQPALDLCFGVSRGQGAGRWTSIPHTPTLEASHLPLLVPGTFSGPWASLLTQALCPAPSQTFAAQVSLSSCLAPSGPTFSSQSLLLRSLPRLLPGPSAQPP